MKSLVVALVSQTCHWQDPRLGRIQGVERDTRLPRRGNGRARTS